MTINYICNGGSLMAETLESIRRVTKSFKFDRKSVIQNTIKKTFTMRVQHDDGSIEFIRLDPQKLHKIFKEAYLKAKEGVK